jgi:hypothetical protein
MEEESVPSAPSIAAMDDEKSPLAYNSPPINAIRPANFNNFEEFLMHPPMFKQIDPLINPTN